MKRAHSPRPRTTRSDLRHMVSALTLLAKLAESAADQVPRTSRSKVLHPSWRKLVEIIEDVYRLAAPVAEPPARR